MRLITFSKSGSERVGVRLGESVVDLSVADPSLPRTLLGLIETGALKQAGATAKQAGDDAHVPLKDIRYLPLIPKPPKVFGFGVNYGSHVGKRPDTPGYYLSTPSRLIAHNGAMVVPKNCKTLDYEAELAIVLGRGGRHIPAKDALEHVAGYTIFNDGSVRGHFQGHATLCLVKNSDATAPLGPEMVTPDELPEGCDGLELTCRRNGEVVQRDTTSNMFWKVPEIIELASSFMSLEAGTVIATGTCGGTVFEIARDQKRSLNDQSLPWLKPGETLESEVEGIGVLRNTIIMEP